MGDRVLLPFKGARVSESKAGSKLLTVVDFEAAAQRKLEERVFAKGTFDYVAGGAGEEYTLRANRQAFNRWSLRPRVLVDVSKVDLSTTVLGQDIPFPILLAPTSFQRLLHPDGELATARAAKKFNTLMVAATVATTSLEKIAETGVLRWFQIYKLLDRELTEQLARRAYAAGYSAIVLTVTAPLLGRRLRDERNDFSLPTHIDLENLRESGLPVEVRGGLGSYFLSRHDPSLTWRDIGWVKDLTPLPLVLKGVMTAEDTQRAVELGIDAVIVSNHGGRQLDGAPATLDVLPEVIEAADEQIEVYIDGGIRTGPDIVKSLALGARAVLLGRPYLWGLAVRGEEGVGEVLELLRDDLQLTMTLAGLPSVRMIDRTAVARAHE
jgi:4-hydroxymandelate oxidase